MNPYLEPATTTEMKMKLKMHCYSPHQGLQKRDEQAQILVIKVSTIRTKQLKAVRQ
jgi:hypothetical protein